jgi:hypothetical protein
MSPVKGVLAVPMSRKRISTSAESISGYQCGRRSATKGDDERHAEHGREAHHPEARTTPS